jgi:peptidoglycan/xylan/chitin deacetylase (PgdA/CDA1 family)
MSSLALTFDDGPDPVWTPLLLDLLADRGARATFFPIAPRAGEASALIERMLVEGHAVGLHCDEHIRHSERKRVDVERDTDRALARLHALGARPTRWRTPWGDRAPFTESLAAERQLQLVGWTVDSHDWRGDSAETMFSGTREGLRAGAVVLAHDGIGPGARRQDAEQTLRYTELVIDHAGDAGIDVEALS